MATPHPSMPPETGSVKKTLAWPEPTKGEFVSQSHGFFGKGTIIVALMRNDELTRRKIPANTDWLA